MTTPAGATVKTAPGSRPPLRKTPKGRTYAQGRPRPSQSSPPGRTGGRTQQGTSGGRSASTAGPTTPNARASTRRSQSPYRQVRSQYRQHVTTNYERVIVAEFIVAVVIVAAAPFTRKDNTGLSPYYGQDVLQLVAIMAAYFILGLVAQAGHGTARIAAWFGGLIVIGIGLGEASYLSKEFGLFGAGQPKQQEQQSAPVETGPQNAGASPAQGGA